MALNTKEVKDLVKDSKSTNGSTANSSDNTNDSSTDNGATKDDESEEKPNKEDRHTPKSTSTQRKVVVGISQFFSKKLDAQGKRCGIALDLTDVERLGLNTNVLNLSDAQLKKLAESIGIITPSFESMLSSLIRLCGTNSESSVECAIQTHVAGEVYMHKGVERNHETDGFSLLPQTIILNGRTRLRVVDMTIKEAYNTLDSSLLRKDDSEDY